MREIAHAPADLDPKTNRHAAGQKLVMDETQRLLSVYLVAEKAASEYSHTPTDEALSGRFTDLVKELLSGLQNMGPDHLREMSWINPILLGSCIQSKNEKIRLAVQKLVQSTTPGSTTPYPAPPVKKEDAEKVEESALAEVAPANNDKDGEVVPASGEDAEAVTEEQPTSSDVAAGEAPDEEQLRAEVNPEPSVEENKDSVGSAKEALPDGGEAESADDEIAHYLSQSEVTKAGDAPSNNDQERIAI